MRSLKKNKKNKRSAMKSVFLARLSDYHEWKSVGSALSLLRAAS